MSVEKTEVLEHCSRINDGRSLFSRNLLHLKSANLSFEQHNLKVSYSSLDILSMSQAKVQQLYKLDRLLQEESGTLHSLQQDKVDINIIMIIQTKASILKKCN